MKIGCALLGEPNAEALLELAPKVVGAVNGTVATWPVTGSIPLAMAYNGSDAVALERVLCAMAVPAITSADETAINSVLVAGLVMPSVIIYIPLRRSLNRTNSLVVRSNIPKSDPFAFNTFPCPLILT